MTFRLLVRMLSITSSDAFHYKFGCFRLLVRMNAPTEPQDTRAS